MRHSDARDQSLVRRRSRTSRIDRAVDGVESALPRRPIKWTLVPDSPIIRVAFKTGPKGLNDVWTEYVPGQGLLDQHGHTRITDPAHFSRVFRNSVGCAPRDYGSA